MPIKHKYTRESSYFFPPDEDGSSALVCFACDCLVYQRMHSNVLDLCTPTPFSSNQVLLMDKPGLNCLSYLQNQQEKQQWVTCYSIGPCALHRIYPCVPPVWLDDFYFTGSVNNQSFNSTPQIPQKRANNGWGKQNEAHWADSMDVRWPRSAHTYITCSNWLVLLI